MTVNTTLLESLMNSNPEKKLEFILHLNEKQYPLENVSVINSPTPVNSPTTRGGVYFSDKFAYKIRGTIHDLSVVPLLTKTMLGPNTEFGEIKITTKLDSSIDVAIHANLTNSVQGPSKIELNMIIIRLE